MHNKNNPHARVAIMLAIAILTQLFLPIGNMPDIAYAAPPAASIRNYIDRTGNTAVSLRVEWSNPSMVGIKAARAVWIDRSTGGSISQEQWLVVNPVLDDTGSPTGVYNDIAVVSLPVRDCGFKNDILYQNRIDLFENVDPGTGLPTGAPAYSAETVFMLGITVDAKGIENNKIREVRPGSRETGYNPALACSFVVPRVYVNAAADGGVYETHANGRFERIFGDDPDNPANLGYEYALNAVKKLRPGITELNLILGLENYIVLTNAYVPLNEIRLYWDQAESAFMGEVDFRGGEIYKAKTANNPLTDGDWHRLYLSGRVDADALLPDDAEWGDIALSQNLMDGIIPPEALGADDFDTVLRYKTLYPGSLYRLHAELQYMAGSDEVREIVGSGFEVVGERPSKDMETALRIIVSKISDEYVKVEIFRINLGMDYVSDNGYKVTGTPETSSAFGPEMEVIINDFASAPANLQAYMKVTNPTVRYYFQAIYTRANMDSRPVSARVPYILQDTGDNVPIMPKGLTIEKLVYDPIRKTTDVTVSWDRPANWITATSNDIYIEFDLNTSHANLDEATRLVDGEGGSYGIFSPQFRTVLAVRREEISAPSIDRLSYTIKGDELFNVVYGAQPVYPPPPAPFPPESLYDSIFWDGEMEKGIPTSGTAIPYPDFLLPNTRYFLTLRSVLWIDDSGLSVKMESNVSSVAAFTTYPTVYEVPLPYEFMIAANPVPQPPQYVNSISLRNSAVDWRYASLVYQPPIPVYYELYMSDRPDDPAPQLAGVTHLNSDGTLYAPWDTDVGWAVHMRLPPHDAASPTGLLDALVIGSPSAAVAGVYIDWQDLKYYDGEKLQPNKIYYFWIRTYIVETHIINGTQTNVLNGVKAFSIMLSATTPPWPQGHDDEYKRRIAPVDFAIAKDADGNLLVSGESATFEWSPTELDVIYEFVITSVRDVNGYYMPDGSGLLFGDPALAPGMDSMYESFIAEFTGDDGRAVDRRLLLDPQKAAIGGGGGGGGSGGGIRGFARDPVSGKFSYTIDRWLFPNSLYYVSLRAVSRDPDPGDLLGGGTPDPQRAAFYTVLNNTGPFVTIPLTTLLLDAPFNLRTIIGAELGFSFSDPAANPAADYQIYMRGPEQAEYMLVGGSQGTLVKSGGFVYGRIINLDFNTAYDIRVARGRQTPEVVYQAAGLATRDPFRSVQIEWMGSATEANDAFLRFQVAIISQTELEELPSEQVEYFELQDLHLSPVSFIVDGREYPYEIYENDRTLNMPNTLAYRATILSKPTRLKDGSIVQRPLQPNMRYYIKVRTRKLSRDNADLSAYSKFAGPVEARTDFLQSAQDEIEEQRRIADNLMDKLAEYERETFYIADAGDRAQGKFLLKEDKIVGMIKTSASPGYLIDISENLKRASADTLYIPGGVLLALQEYRKTLTIRFEGAEYVFTMNTIDLRYEKIYQDMAKKAGTSEFLIKLNESRSDSMVAPEVVPAGSEGITAVHRLEATVIASNRSYANISGLIREYVYNERTGLLAQKLASLALNTEAAPIYEAEDPAAGAYAQYETEEKQNKERNAAQAKKEANDAYVIELTNDIKNLVSYKIGDILEGRNGYRSLVADSIAVAAGTATGAGTATIAGAAGFNEPLTVTLFHAQRRSGKISPFISYDSKEWFKLTQNLAQRPDSISFEVLAPGYYSAVFAGVLAEDMPEGSDAEAALLAVASRYDLSDIFIGIDNGFQPGLPVLNREAVLLYERVLGLEGKTFGMNMSQKVTALGLDVIIRPGSINMQMDRQRAAVLLVRFYVGLLGLGSDGKLRSNGNIAIFDSTNIEKQYVGEVEFCVGQGLLKLSNGRFEPTRAVTRAELIVGLARILAES